MSAKVAVVTGASGGIGSAICRQLARDGYRLIMLDRDAAKATDLAAELRAVRADAVAEMLSVDLSDHADIARVASAIDERYPQIDALYNNAGVLTESLRFSKHGNELHFEVNALAPLQLIDRLRPALERCAAPLVVNTSAGISLGEKRLSFDELVHPATFSKLFGPYTRSKAALNVLSTALARELRPAIVRAADPGPTRTALTRGPGTPLWMRLFFFALPGTAHAARQLVDAGDPRRFEGRSGIFVSGGRVKPLPPDLAAAAFQDAFLERCRRHVADG